ncbi:hypothetical protein BRADI_4g05736v3 [Brachypodium distachyon]|uniref:Uncharacterized protein n=1 Tax=Brachypodium distachyon TaxID=15368 RepID=A0A0Q3PBK8_BRADI|nr:hypothetical protein BRADI_4g05736v3 [Brachypodium distachyon]
MAFFSPSCIQPQKAASAHSSPFRCCFSSSGCCCCGGGGGSWRARAWRRTRRPRLPQTPWRPAKSDPASPTLDPGILGKSKPTSLPAILWQGESSTGEGKMRAKDERWRSSAEASGRGVEPSRDEETRSIGRR